MLLLPTGLSPGGDLVFPDFLEFPDAVAAFRNCCCSSTNCYLGDGE
jgi:hypothetical protein